MKKVRYKLKGDPANHKSYIIPEECVLNKKECGALTIAPIGIHWLEFGCAYLDWKNSGENGKEILICKCPNSMEFIKE